MLIHPTSHLIRLQIGGRRTSEQLHVGLGLYKRVLDENRKQLGLRPSLLLESTVDLDDQASLQRQIAKLCSDRKNPPEVLIIELVSSVPFLVDSVASVLAGFLANGRSTSRRPRLIAPKAIVLAANDSRAIQSSVVLKNTLEHWESVGVPIVLALRKERELEWHWRNKGHKKLKGNVWRSDEPSPLSPSEVERQLRVVFGHFALDVGASRHSSVYVSAANLIGNLGFARQLSEIGTDLVGRQPTVVPVGLDINAMTGLAGDLAEVSDGTVCTDASRYSDGPVLFLADTLPTATDLVAIQHEYRERGATRFGALGIARLVDAKLDEEISSRTIVDLPYGASEIGGTHCQLCNLGSEPLRGDITSFERSIAAFNPVEFWSLVGAKPEYVEVGHWVSQRTRHHYFSRVAFQALLHDHAYGLALRLRNAIQQNAVLSSWIKLIVCPDDDEAKILAHALRRVLQLSEESVVVIPRNTVLLRVAGRMLSTDVLKTLRSEGILKRLSGQNVIVVDQGVQLFGTLGVIDAICRHAGSTVLACAVVLDRASRNANLGEYFSHTHFVRLYSWPNPPKHSNECACGNVEQPQ